MCAVLCHNQVSVVYNLHSNSEMSSVGACCHGYQTATMARISGTGDACFIASCQPKRDDEFAQFYDSEIDCFTYK